MDKISKQKRSENMSKIKSRDTSIDQSPQISFLSGIQIQKKRKISPRKTRHRSPKIQNRHFHQRMFLAPSSRL